jgi:hypothetical protein
MSRDFGAGARRGVQHGLADKYVTAGRCNGPIALGEDGRARWLERLSYLQKGHIAHPKDPSPRLQVYTYFCTSVLGAVLRWAMHGIALFFLVTRFLRCAFMWRSVLLAWRHAPVPVCRGGPQLLVSESARFTRACRDARPLSHSGGFSVSMVPVKIPAVLAGLDMTRDSPLDYAITVRLYFKCPFFE